MKVLGTSWNLPTDTIFVNGSHNLSSEVTTKREALQSVSRLYDPLGLFSPATLNAKQFIQELWKQEKDWDETLSQSQQQEWSKICESLTPLRHYPDILEEMNTNCSALLMPLPKPIQQQYTSTLQ